MPVPENLEGAGQGLSKPLPEMMAWRAPAKTPTFERRGERGVEICRIEQM
jgi:hypothetical protein